MADGTDRTGRSPTSDGRLRLVYVAGIALNAIALALAAAAGEFLIAVTFGFVIVYLLIRYRMIARS